MGLDDYVLVDYAEYRNQYGYYDFYSGSQDFKLYDPVTLDLISSTPAEFDKDNIFTIFAYDQGDSISPDLWVVKDKLEEADSGFASIRFVHLGRRQEIPSLSVSLKNSSTPLAQLSWLQKSGYIDLAAGAYELTVTAEVNGSTQTLLETGPVDLVSGRNYTLIFSGSLEDDTVPAFNAKLYADPEEFV